MTTSKQQSGQERPAAEPSHPGLKVSPGIAHHIENAPNAFNVYCSATEFAYTPWDITMSVAQMTGKEGDVVKVLRHGLIVMNPGHAKAMLAALATTVKAYENQFGEIDLKKIGAAMGLSIPTP